MPLYATSDSFEKNLNELADEVTALAEAAAGKDLPSEDLHKAADMVKLIPQLFAKIAHGEQGHRDWLEKAIEAHFTGQPMPEYVAK